MADIFDTIIDFVSTDSWTSACDFVEAHPELLDEQTDQLIAELIDELDNERLQAALSQNRDLLMRCREVGVAPASDHSGTVVPAAFVADIVEAQRFSTAAVVDSAAAEALIQLYEDILSSTLSIRPHNTMSPSPAPAHAAGVFACPLAMPCARY